MAERFPSKPSRQEQEDWLNQGGVVMVPGGDVVGDVRSLERAVEVAADSEEADAKKQQRLDNLAAGREAARLKREQEKAAQGGEQKPPENV